MRTEATLRVRPARVADAPLLCAAERDTARVPGHLVSRPDELSEEGFARKIAELAAAGSYLVAERDGAVVGHALLDCAGSQAALAHVRTLTIVVHPSYTGQGVGAAGIEAVLDWARADPEVERI